MEEAPKRKTHTSTAVKRRYNDKTYTMVRASLPKDLVARFKAKCEADGIPQAQVIKKRSLTFWMKIEKAGQGISPLPGRFLVLTQNARKLPASYQQVKSCRRA